MQWRISKSALNSRFSGKNTAMLVQCVHLWHRDWSWCLDLIAFYFQLIISAHSDCYCSLWFQFLLWMSTCSHWHRSLKIFAFYATNSSYCQCQGGVIIHTHICYLPYITAVTFYCFNERQLWLSVFILQFNKCLVHSLINHNDTACSSVAFVILVLFFSPLFNLF